IHILACRALEVLWPRCLHGLHALGALGPEGCGVDDDLARARWNCLRWLSTEGKHLGLPLAHVDALPVLLEYIEESAARAAIRGSAWWGKVLAAIGKALASVVHMEGVKEEVFAELTAHPGWANYMAWGTMALAPLIPQADVLEVFDEMGRHEFSG